MGLIGNAFGRLRDAISPISALRREKERVALEQKKLELESTKAAVELNRRRSELANETMAKVFDRLGHGSRDALRRRSFKQVDHNENRSERFVSQDIEINSLLDEQLTKAQTRSVGLFGENGIARSAVETRVTHEVGSGLTIKPIVKARIDGAFPNAQQAKGIAEAFSEAIRCWSMHGADRGRQMTFPMVQRLICREFANEGECFFLLGDLPFDGEGPYAGPLPTAVQFFSPRQCETPPDKQNDPLVRLGVQYLPNGVIQGYWMRSQHPGDTKQTTPLKWDFFPRFDTAGQPRMVHVFDPLVAGQSRGLPWLLAAFNKIIDFDDYHEAELVTKQIEACVGVVFKMSRKDRPESAWDLALQAAEETVEDTLMEKMQPGFIQRIGEDDEVTTVDPKRPGSIFLPFMEGSLRMIAGSANIPYELIAKNFLNTTFSSGRLSCLDGQLGFKARRSILTDMGLAPIYRRAVHSLVFAHELYGLLPVEEYVRNPDWFSRHRWYGNEMGMIDTEKEVKAYALGIETELMNISDFHEERGWDTEDQEAERAEEMRRKIDRDLMLEEYEQQQRQAKGLPPKVQDATDPKKAGMDAGLSSAEYLSRSTTMID